MDTTPFHLILFALDIVVLGGLFLWFRIRRKRLAMRSEVYLYEKSLYTHSRPPRLSSFIWDVMGVLLFGGFGLVCFAALSRFIYTDFAQNHLYHFNAGQCIAEGIAIHWTLFFAVTAALLYWNHRKILASLFGICAAFLSIASFNCLYWEPYHSKVEYYKIETSKIKIPLRIVFVSDIQTDRITSHEINTLKTIQKQDADLIILGGDYLQTFGSTRNKELPEEFRQMLIDHPLKAPLGVYAIAGNNGGSAEDAKLFKDTGIDYIQNLVIFDDLGYDEGWNPSIDLVLLDWLTSCSSHYGTDVVKGKWKNKDGNKESTNFTVMAGHAPHYAIDGFTPKNGNPRGGFRNAEKAPDLMLAGHTHGGQIVIPFFGPLSTAHITQVPRDMMSGFFTYPNGGHLLVTRGSGLERGWAPRIRLFCPSEISVIDIVPAK